jgi:hypothetical protein
LRPEADIERGTKGIVRSFFSVRAKRSSHKCALGLWRNVMIRKLASGEYRLYSRKINPKTGKRRNLGTFKSRAAAEKHERDVQYFKRH